MLRCVFISRRSAGLPLLTTEWAATLDDPEKLRRFTSFVNAPETPDPSVRFTLERGQIRPANRSERREEVT